MTLDQTARDLVRTILELQEQRAPEYIIVGTVRRVLAAERERCAVVAEERFLNRAVANAIRALP
jgi:hypothetical protein